MDKFSPSLRSKKPRGAPLSGTGLAGEPGAYPAVSAGSREAIKFFALDQVAEALNVSPRTVRRWIDRRELVAHRFGAAVRISAADLKAFLALSRAT